MSQSEFDKKLKHFQVLLAIAFQSDEFMTYVAQMGDAPTEIAKQNLKRSLTVYNLLKKLADERDDGESFMKYLKHFLQTDAKTVMTICVFGTLSVDLNVTLENIENNLTEGEYLSYGNALKTLHDLRKFTGITA
jgi:hypothetical protein